jgi:hypothetical protein
MEPAHVTLTGDLPGDYMVEDRRPEAASSCDLT